MRCLVASLRAAFWLQPQPLVADIQRQREARRAGRCQSARPQAVDAPEPVGSRCAWTCGRSNVQRDSRDRFDRAPPRGAARPTPGSARATFSHQGRPPGRTGRSRWRTDSAGPPIATPPVSTIRWADSDLSARKCRSSSRHTGSLPRTAIGTWTAAVGGLKPVGGHQSIACARVKSIRDHEAREHIVPQPSIDLPPARLVRVERHDHHALMFERQASHADGHVFGEIPPALARSAGRLNSFASRELIAEYSAAESSRNMAGASFTRTGNSICPGVQVNRMRPERSAASPVTPATTIRHDADRSPQARGGRRRAMK